MRAALRYVAALCEGVSIPARSRRGYAAALGCLPQALLAPHAGPVFDALLGAAGPPEAVHEIETDARRLALNSLTRLAIGEIQVAGGVASKPHLPAVFAAVLEATNDYTIDSRGDIGSRVREEAMECLQRLLTACAAAPNSAELLDPLIPARVVQALVQQSMEKIDRTRGIAGGILANLCTAATTPHIPRQAELAQLLGPANELHWQVPRETFPRTVQLLRYDECVFSSLLCVCVLLGGGACQSLSFFVWFGSLLVCCYVFLCVDCPNFRIESLTRSSCAVGTAMLLSPDSWFLLVGSPSRWSRRHRCASSST